MKRRVLGILFAMFAAASNPTTASADVIAGWDFNNYTATANNIFNPVADSGNATNNGIATGQSLGMTNNYTYNGGEGPGSIDASQVISGSGNGSVDNQWRIRGPTNSGGGGPGQSNGWNSAAPEYTQGGSFAANTTGYTNLSITFGWYVTTQGAADLMVRESSNGGATWTNVLATPLEQTTGQGTINTKPAIYTINLAAGTNDVELVSAYNPILGNTYANAASAAAGTPTGLNNSSGNWRFTDVSINGTLAPVPEPSSLILLGLGLTGLLGSAVRRRFKMQQEQEVAAG